MPQSSDRTELWAPGVTYVIGHQRPDTDAIASALGYAWFLRESGHEDVIATRAGQPGAQARYALERFEQPSPRLLTGVAPTFHHVVEKVTPLAPGASLADALDRLGSEEHHVVPVVREDGTPAGVVTPLALARAFARSLGNRGGRLKGGDTLPPLPDCGLVAEPIPTFVGRTRISDSRHVILREEGHLFLVVDDHGRYEGLASQRHLLAPPRARLILVDHNELSQAVAGAEEAEIVGVLDHHRLGNPPTAAPIPFVVDTVGSTSTLVTERCRANRLTPPRPIAGMLLSGILSDTLVFRSPTTLSRDKAAAEWLAGICRVDLLLYGKELLEAAPGLASRTPADIIDGDRKEYEMGGLRVSVAQVEVTGRTGMEELPHRRAELLEAMAARRRGEGIALICLMVTDVVSGRSRMLVRGEANLVDALPFDFLSDGEYDLEDMVSRKKQLIPALQSAIESTQ